MPTSTGRVTTGRPNKVADDDGRFDSRTRIAWLLRMNRLYGPDPDLAVARRCVGAFSGRLGPVTPSQISRWENGVLPVPYRVIRTYEDLLGLPAGQLVAAVDTVHQVRSVRPGTPRLDRGFTAGARLARELDDLLDRCLADGPMPAVDWDGMSARVVAIPHVYLPRPTWHVLVARLLAEMSVGRGLDYQHRWEALRRLQGHPVAREVIAAAVAEMIADPASQIVVDPLMLLAHDRAATQLLVDEVAAPTSERTLRAALEVCELAAEAGRFSGVDAHVLGMLARGHAGDDGLPAGVRRAATDLVSRLGLPGTRCGARPVVPDRAETVAGMVRAAEAVLDVTTRGTSVTENRMLSRLVDELLFAPQVDVRLGAATLLAASPFGKPLADALAIGLSGDRPPREELAAALSMIGGAEHRPALEALLTGPWPHEVAVQAALGLGNLPGRTRDTVLTDAVTAAARHHEVLRALVYAAGMQRATAVLSAVRDRRDLPAETRAAARWWLAHPASLE